MNQSFLISTECPTCGAPLDFSEGANAVQCAHCKSNLLITGRKTVLRYYVDPNLKQGEVPASALTSDGGEEPPLAGKAVRQELVYLPFFRFRGHDFHWQTIVHPRADEAKNEETPGLSPLLNLLSGSLDNHGFSETIQSIHTHHAEKEETGFEDRYIEKNFIALKSAEFGIYSLGVRPGVLKLKLFGAQDISAKQMICPDLNEEEALDRGLKPAESLKLIYRQVLGRMLSLVYFPFLIVEVETRGNHTLSIVDAVSGSAVRKGAPPGLMAILEKKLESAGEQIHFRALACPNCGWDLPVRPDDILFFCRSCGKGWEISGERLIERPSETVRFQGVPYEGEISFLPFWIFEKKISGANVKFLVPAFRYRRLKTLLDLATAFVRRNMPFEAFKPERGEYTGCFYDQEDAFRLAEAVEARLALEKKGKPDPFPGEKEAMPDSATLSWLPFLRKGVNLSEPLTGITLTQNLLF